MDHEQFQTPVKTVIRKIIVYHKMPIEICNKKKYIKTFLTVQ